MTRRGASTDEPTSLSHRLLALLVDGLVVLALSVPLALLPTVSSGQAPGPLEVGLLWFVYRSLADGAGGSLGKRLLRLRVAGPRGGRAGLAAGATRNLWGLGSLLAVALPEVVGNALAVGVSVTVGVSIARDPDDRGWHDRLAGTRVRRPADA